MFNRIEMDIIQVSAKVDVIPYHVFSITSLSNRHFSFSLPGLIWYAFESTCFQGAPAEQPLCRKPLRRFQTFARVIIQSSGGKRQIECKWSGSKHIASTLNGCFSSTSFQTCRKMRSASFEVKKLWRSNVTTVKK